MDKKYTGRLQKADNGKLNKAAAEIEEKNASAESSKTSLEEQASRCTDYQYQRYLQKQIDKIESEKAGREREAKSLYKEEVERLESDGYSHAEAESRAGKSDDGCRIM